MYEAVRYKRICCPLARDRNSPSLRPNPPLSLDIFSMYIYIAELLINISLNENFIGIWSRIAVTRMCYTFMERYGKRCTRVLRNLQTVDSSL